MLRSLVAKSTVVAGLGVVVAILLGLYVGRGNLAGSLQIIVLMIGVVLAVLIPPKYLLIAAILLLPFDFLIDYLPISLPMNLMPADLALVAYALSAAVRRLARPSDVGVDKARASVVAAGVLAALLIAVGLFSAVESGAMMVAIRKLGRIALIIIAVWATPGVLTLEDMIRSCKVLLAWGGFTAIYALVEGALDMAGVHTRIFESVGPLPRLLGGFKDPNFFAHYLSMVIPVVFARVLMGAKLWTKQLFIFILLIVAAIGTFSRGGAIGLGAGMLVVLALTFRQPSQNRRSSSGRSFSIAVSFCALLAILASSTPNIWSVISTRFSGATKYGTDPTAVLRLRIWKNALHLLATSPIYGIGPGQFLTRMAETSPDTAFYAHNSLLEATVEMGVIGGALLLAIIVLLLSASVSAARTYMWPENYGFSEDVWVVGVVGGLVGGVVSSFFLSNALFMAITMVMLILASNFWPVGAVLRPST